MVRSESTLTRQLARFVRGFSWDALCPGQVEKAKAFFLDRLGFAFAGTGTPPKRMMVALVERLGGKPEVAFQRPEPIDAAPGEG